MFLWRIVILQDVTLCSQVMAYRRFAWKSINIWQPTPGQISEDTFLHNLSRETLKCHTTPYAPHVTPLQQDEFEWYTRTLRLVSAFQV
jgi:hypothetical protein